MKIGIVSRRKSKKNFLRKIRIREISQEIVAAEIPFEVKKTKRLIKRAEKKLKRFGTEKIIYERNLKEVPFDTAQAFYKIAGKGAKILAQRFEAGKPFCLGIKQKNLDERALFIIKELIYEAKKINLMTETEETALCFQKEIMEEFGAVAEVLSYDFFQKDGLTVNLDESAIWIFGKLECKDFTVEAENFGFDIDSMELFSLQNGNFKEAVIKSCVCGKNKLTLNEI